MKVFVWCGDCAEFHECRHPTAEEDPGYSEALRKTLWIHDCGHIIKVEAEGLMGEIKKKGKRVILSTGPAREEDFEDTDSDMDRLYEWVVENDLQDDPERISKIHGEARRRWPTLITRRISEIVEGTLRKEAEG